MEIVEQAEAFIDERGKLHVLFDEPRRNYSQTVALYEGDDLIGGGVNRYHN